MPLFSAPLTWSVPWTAIFAWVCANLTTTPGSTVKLIPEGMVKTPLTTYGLFSAVQVVFSDNGPPEITVAANVMEGKNNPVDKNNAPKKPYHLELIRSFLKFK